MTMAMVAVAAPAVAFPTVAAAPDVAVGIGHGGGRVVVEDGRAPETGDVEPAQRTRSKLGVVRDEGVRRRSVGDGGGGGVDPDDVGPDDGDAVFGGDDLVGFGGGSGEANAGEPHAEQHRQQLHLTGRFLRILQQIKMYRTRQESNRDSLR